MRFINNWITQLNQPMTASATSLPVPGPALARLTDGSYLLTLVNSASVPDQTQWEVIEVTVGNGVVQAARGREGTTRQAWPVGTLIYCGVTAGTLNEFAQTIESLVARVTALDGGGGVDPEPEPSDGALTDPAGRALTDQSGSTLVPAA